MPEMPGVLSVLWVFLAASILFLLIGILWGVACLAVAALLKEAFGIDVFARLRRGKK